MRLFLVWAAFALPFVGWAAVALMRKARHRALAASLGARHVAAGMFAPGTILGQDFEIEATQVGKSYGTRFQVTARDAADRFLLEPEFFRGAPNWEFAKVLASRKERVFLWEISLPGTAQPSRAQQAELLAWMPPIADLSGLHEELKAAGIRSIFIADGTVSTRCSGIVSNLERIRRVLGALQRLAPSKPAGNRSSTRAA